MIIIRVIFALILIIESIRRRIDSNSNVIKKLIILMKCLGGLGAVTLVLCKSGPIS